jgi:hypothetical protein
MFEMLKLKLPGFDSVAVWAALVVPTLWGAKVSEVGLSVAAARLDPATPLSETLCGAPTRESLKTTVALLVPAAVGVNVTETLQAAPAAREDPQVVAVWKSAPSAPESEMPEIVKSLPPEFVRMTVRGAEVVAMSWGLNVKAEALNDRTGPGVVEPIPDRPIPAFAVEFRELVLKESEPEIGPV